MVSDPLFISRKLSPRLIFEHSGGKSESFLKLTLSDGIYSNTSDFCVLPAVYGSASGLFASVMDFLYDFFSALNLSLVVLVRNEYLSKLLITTGFLVFNWSGLVKQYLRVII